MSGSGWLVVVIVSGCASPLPALPSDDTGDTSGTGGSGTTDGSGSAGETTEPTPPGCGNGVIEAGETCDDRGESAECNDDCTDVVCGAGIINETAGEVCDGAMLAGETCEGQGFSVGELACSGTCTFDLSGCFSLPDAPALQIEFAAIKRFDFSWDRDARADYYGLEERATPRGSFVPLGDDLFTNAVSHERPLHLRAEASYRVRACNDGGCSDATVVDVTDSLAGAVGYVKASNTDVNDRFGGTVALSADGNTLAVGAANESSIATGIGGSQTDDSASQAGAVYVFTR
ncbi:MAG: hypothetical protein AAF721_39725, partial [Myxococcota bacterium]